MKQVSKAEFLRWAAGKGMRLDPKYPDSAVLGYVAGGKARFWVVPEEAEQRPYLLMSLLELMGEWERCYVWRHLGRWPDASRMEERINDRVEATILEGLGIPMGTADVVVFGREELDALVTLLFSTTIFGWSVGEDLYVVPDHGRQILQTDHHGVVHVTFRYPEEVKVWERELAARGFALPKELPDATFKRPGWMGGERE